MNHVNSMIESCNTSLSQEKRNSLEADFNLFKDKSWYEWSFQDWLDDLWKSSYEQFQQNKGAFDEKSQIQLRDAQQLQEKLQLPSYTNVVTCYIYPDSFSSFDAYAETLDDSSAVLKQITINVPFSLWRKSWCYNWKIHCLYQRAISQNEY